MSCSLLHNDYDGLTHDYRNKRGLVFQKIYLPKYAPPEWQDRNTLWNAVEASERTKDSRLAREIIVALPIEFGEQVWSLILDEFVERNFVNRGMCADVCVHDTDGHNPHAHILLTVRPLGQNGTWQSKTQKEYICIKDGIEKPMTAGEFRINQQDGWEKQYLYTDGHKKFYLPPSRAGCLERVDKHPKSSRYGRQNPIAADWNSEETLCKWRENWARSVNNYLYNLEDPRIIDHRSYAARGIRKQPTAHVGAVGMILMRQKKYSTRYDINRLIQADNQWIDDWVEAIATLTKLVVLSIFKLADALETARENLVVLHYAKRALRSELYRETSSSQEYQRTVQKIGILNGDIQIKEAELKDAQERSERFFIKPSTRNELYESISRLQNEIEDLKSQKLMYMNRIGLKSENPSESIRAMQEQKNMIRQIQSKQADNEKAIEKTVETFKELKESAHCLPDELERERAKIRTKKEDAAIDRIEKTYGCVYDSDINDAFDNAEKAIGEWQPPKQKAKETEEIFETTYEEPDLYEPETAEETDRNRDDWDER